MSGRPSIRSPSLCIPATIFAPRCRCVWIESYAIICALVSLAQVTARIQVCARAIVGKKKERCERPNVANSTLACREACSRGLTPALCRGHTPHVIWGEGFRLGTIRHAGRNARPIPAIRCAGIADEGSVVLVLHGRYSRPCVAQIRLHIPVRCWLPSVLSV